MNTSFWIVAVLYIPLTLFMIILGCIVIYMIIKDNRKNKREKEELGR